jgi:hypothetical protein
MLADEPSEPMLRRRRQMKKVLRVARMLRDLDAVTPPSRPVRHRSSHVAFGRV